MAVVSKQISFSASKLLNPSYFFSFWLDWGVYLIATETRVHMSDCLLFWDLRILPSTFSHALTIPTFPAFKSCTSAKSWRSCTSRAQLVFNNSSLRLSMRTTSCAMPRAVLSTRVDARSRRKLSYSCKLRDAHSYLNLKLNFKKELENKYNKLI